MEVIKMNEQQKEKQKVKSNKKAMFQYWFDKGSWQPKAFKGGQ